MSMFKKASKQQARLRLALVGPSGSGKTYTALRIAKGLGGRVAVLDTERGSASKYSDAFAFDVAEMASFAPQDYAAAIKAAEAEGYNVLIIDSLSHAWMGKGGALEMVDAANARSKGGNSFTAWREVTPKHNEMVEAILQSGCHVIATMRAKTEYVIEEDSRGKKVPRKVGLAPVQRDGLEFEFDVVGDMDEARLVITKTRCPALAKAVLNEPGEALGESLRAWLTDGAAAATPAQLEAQKARWTPAKDVAVVGFGPLKGRTLSSLTAAELSECIGVFKEKLREYPDAKSAPAMQKNLASLQGEADARAGKVTVPAPTEARDAEATPAPATV